MKWTYRLGFERMKAVRCSTLPPTERFIMMVLASYADAEGVAWPSVPRIAADTGFSERAVQKAIRRLVKRQLLSDDGLSNAGTKRYILSRPEPRSGGVNDVRLGGERRSSRGERRSPEGYQEGVTKKKGPPLPPTGGLARTVCNLVVDNLEHWHDQMLNDLQDNPARDELLGNGYPAVHRTEAVRAFRATATRMQSLHQHAIAYCKGVAVRTGLPSGRKAVLDATREAGAALAQLDPEKLAPPAEGAT